MVEGRSQNPAKPSRRFLGDGGTRDENHWLASQWTRVLDRVAAKSVEIHRQVESDKARLSQSGLSSTTIQTQLIRRYVRSAMIRSSAINSAVALPVSIPGIGAIPSFVGSLVVSILYTYKLEIELCYRVAYTSQTSLADPELKHVVFWLVHLTNFREIQKQAKDMGVRISLSSFVQGLAVRSASRGMGHLCVEMGVRLTSTLGSPAKWAGFLIGTPLSGFYGYRSTRGTAKRAVEFFIHSGR